VQTMNANAVTIAEPYRPDSQRDQRLRSRLTRADMVSAGPMLLGDPAAEDVICEGIVGQSVALRNVVTQLETVAPPIRRCSSAARPGRGRN